MDLLPVNQVSTNKVDAAINLANDGGSKSNTGFLNNRDSEQKKPEEKIDEVSFSKKSNTEEEIDAIDNDLILFELIKNCLSKIKDFILKKLNLKKKEITNIYEKNSL